MIQADIINQLNKLQNDIKAAFVNKQDLNEEQTKQKFILRMLSILGYDQYSDEIKPEDAVDTGDRIDYTLSIDGDPVAIIECKKLSVKLGKQEKKQLNGYFSRRDIKLAILTNGDEYQFFTNIKNEKIMDLTPYKAIRLSGVTDNAEFSFLEDYLKGNIKNSIDNYYVVPSYQNKVSIDKDAIKSQLSETKSQLEVYKSKLKSIKQSSDSNKQEIDQLKQQIETLNTEKNSLDSKLRQIQSYERQMGSVLKTSELKMDLVYNGDFDKFKVDDKIVKGMVDLIDPALFNPESKFFDPCCRYGEFLIEIKDRLMKSPSMVKKFPNEHSRSDYIIENQLYALMPDDKGLKAVRWALYNTALLKLPNIIGFKSDNEDYSNYYRAIKLWQYYIRNKTVFTDETVKTLDSLGELKDMKFTCVVSNPPYNDDVYIDFVNLGVAVTEQCGVYITPAKWQAKSGQKNEQFRKDIVPYMSKIVYYPCAQELFDIRNLDGISYYKVERECLTNKVTVDNKSNIIKSLVNSIDQCKDRLILNNLGYNIVHEHIMNSNFKPLKIQLCSNVFGIGNPEVSQLHRERDEKHNIKIADAFWGKGSPRSDAYININIIKKNSHLLDKFNVVMMGMGGNCYYDSTGMTLGMNKITVKNPGEATTNDYMCLHECDSEIEALSYKSYLETKLIRFLVMTGLVGQRLDMEETWRFIPDPEKFDHIFTDAELYNKYDITVDEQKLIESTIKDRTDKTK